MDDALKQGLRVEAERLNRWWMASGIIADVIKPFAIWLVKPSVEKPRKIVAIGCYRCHNPIVDQSGVWGCSTPGCDVYEVPDPRHSNVYIDYDHRMHIWANSVAEVNSLVPSDCHLPIVAHVADASGARSQWTLPLKTRKR